MSTAERVANGAAWLDENRPLWILLIDLDELDTASSSRCVLGQVFGHFDERPEDLTAATPFGFNVTFDEEGGYDRREYDVLDEEWRRVITARREATDGT